MRTLELNQMENVNGGGWFGCLLGIALIVGGSVSVAVGGAGVIAGGGVILATQC